MTEYTFEYWLKGKMNSLKTVEAETIKQAVSKLSEEYKEGVFKLAYYRIGFNAFYMTD